jgi:acetylornithine/N-succinyldiaminopimelate aminotransferase
MNQSQAITQLFQDYVVPTYGRFNLLFTHGAGSYLWDAGGKKYLDLGGGIAVCALGHAHPAISEILSEQSRKLVHISNLYHHELQGRLAQALVQLIGPGKCFFCNSGAEANETLFKLARKFGREEGRYEIITTLNSFHGRTLAGIAATGQEKMKAGFQPAVAGFRHVPYNNLEAMRQAISPGTAAILIEAIQGEGGITPASPEYLLGLRRLCDEKKLLLLLDEVQAGHFRTGTFQSYQRLLEGNPNAEQFLPDAVSMAKSLGNGFPIGAAWIREPYSALLSPGTHASTFGGNPLGCAVALKVLEIIQREGLADNARNLGEHLRNELLHLASEHPRIIKAVRGFGFMIGIELAPDFPGFANDPQAPAQQFIRHLHAAGLLAIPAGNQVIRFLPPLNLQHSEAKEALQIIKSVLKNWTA